MEKTYDVTPHHFTAKHTKKEWAIPGIPALSKWAKKPQVFRQSWAMLMETLSKNGEGGQEKEVREEEGEEGRREGDGGGNWGNPSPDRASRKATARVVLMVTDR